jgi:hypothetical protein
MVHYAQGDVKLAGNPVTMKFGQSTFDSMKEGEILETGRGRAEVLLAPGSVLRIGEFSSLRMISTDLSDAKLELLEGAALLEVSELEKDITMSIRHKDALVVPEKVGLYRFDSDPASLRVYEGKARVVTGDQTVDVKKGRRLMLDGSAELAKFDTDEGDSLHRWSNRRARYLSMANLSAARSVNNRGLSSGYRGWYWNPYFGMMTFIPGRGILYSPWGFPYYSPYDVYRVYNPRPVYSGPSMSSGGTSFNPRYNSNLGYSTASRSYGGYSGSSSSGMSSAPAASAPAASSSPRSGGEAVGRGSTGGGRSQ